MGWFNDQIHDRRILDDEALENAFADVVSAVLGKKAAGTSNDDRRVVQDAVGEILEYFHLSAGEIPDSITYSGNGEPTLHPEFGPITDGLIQLRDKYFPKAIISCLSNSTQLHRADVVRALRRIENPLMKLDAGTQDTFRRMNQPFVDLDVETVTQQLEQFEGKLTVQTMMLKGELDDGSWIDNTTGEEVSAWLERIRRIHPHTVMLYPIDRETPANKLIKLGTDVLEPIADKVREMGIETKVY